MVDGETGGPLVGIEVTAVAREGGDRFEERRTVASGQELTLEWELR